MTTTGFSQRSVAALAALTHDIRPDWNEAGIAAEIRRHTHLPLVAVAQAMLTAATDPANMTPACLSQDGNRSWDGWRPRCKRHPENRSARANGECGSCFADANGVDYEPRPARDANVDPHPLEAALARIGER